MRLRVGWTPAETEPERAEVLRLQGLPPASWPAPRTAALLDDALVMFRELAEPRALLDEVSGEVFGAVYRGEGRNAPGTPLDSIFPEAERLALFAATVGQRITTRIRELFEQNEPALAAMLDSAASASADRLGELLGERYLAAADPESAGRWRALAYSPGYCGWHVTGQKALFERLKPGEIGIRLNASCLMEPLKSVSGVLVAGAGEIHRFAPVWPFCEDCRDRPCRARIASLREP